MHFIERNIIPPKFVYADPIETGNLLGSVLAEKIKAGTKNIVIILGSSNSAVALFRTQALTYRALQASESKPLNLTLIELDAWNVDNETLSKLNCCIDENISFGQKTIVMCANDAIMDEIDRSLPEKYNQYVELIGCDGSRRQDGRLLLDTTQSGKATVDINPREQGEIAADIVNVELIRTNSKSSGYHVRRVKQKLLRRN